MARKLRGHECREAEKALEKLAAAPYPPRICSGWDDPRDVDTIEWFASGQDLCALHATLFKDKDKPAYKPRWRSWPSTMVA
ncbi:MAG: hypothetical protein R3E66_23490 [bacterium]